MINDCLLVVLWATYVIVFYDGNINVNNYTASTTRLPTNCRATVDCVETLKLALNVLLFQGQTKLADHLRSSSISLVDGSSGVDGRDEGPSGDVIQKSSADLLRRTDSSISRISESDERDNEIIRECYREEMSEKRDGKSTDSKPTLKKQSSRPSTALMAGSTIASGKHD